MAGAGAGACGSFVLNPGTPHEQKLPAAAADVPLPRGSVLRICTPGGAGYGDAKKRVITAVRQDVIEGRISPEYSSRTYLEGSLS
jgi:N-methylhydantoinase B